MSNIQPPVHIHKFSEDTINRQFIPPDMNTNNYLFGGTFDLSPDHHKVLNQV